MTYGLLPLVDVQTLEKALDQIRNNFSDQVLRICEIGIWHGQTSLGIREYFQSKGRVIGYTAIDNQKHFTIENPFVECNFLIGNSRDVAYRVEDDSQHFIFLDADHSFASVVQDFFCYKDKLKVNGMFAFHDTGKHIRSMEGYQQGPKDDPDSYVTVRKALTKIGLLDNNFNGWKLVYDEADPKEMGGMSVFLKISM